MQWTLTPHQGVSVLALNGFIAAHHVERLKGAVQWADREADTSLVVDLTHLYGWSPEGEYALGIALSSWAAAGRRVIVCIPSTASPFISDPSLAAVDRCSSLTEALSTWQS
jgi:hypothetical protein